MQTRRTFLYLTSAALGMPCMANEAPTVNEHHEQEVLEFALDALEDSIRSGLIPV